MMERSAEYKAEVAKAIETLRSGGVILYPTDTVWGLGCDATNSAAVRRLIELKQRPDGKAMLSLVDSIATAERYMERMPEAAEMLIDVAVRPLTLIYPDVKGMAPELLAADGSAGMRIVTEGFAADICRRLRRPLVSTSANISGEPMPNGRPSDDSAVCQGADYAAPQWIAPENETGRPSQIIKIAADGSIRIIRE